MSDTSSGDEERNHINETPPGVMNAATTAEDDLIPMKSKLRYEKAYNDFMGWKINKKATSFSQNVLLAYFQELSNKFKSATLWTIYSILKSTLNIKHNVNMKNYYKLTAFLKGKGEGYTAKKSKTFLPEQIKKFLDEAPDQLYLFTKMGLIFGIMGACRRQELYNLMFNDVQVMDSTIVVTIHSTKTKTKRTFNITGSFCQLSQKYILLRPKQCSDPHFFLLYIAGKCTNQRNGINKFGSLGKTIANYLGLPDPDLYTGHCFRRTSATLLVDAGGDITALKRHGGWKSTTVAEGYIDDSMQGKCIFHTKLLTPLKIQKLGILTCRVRQPLWIRLQQLYKRPRLIFIIAMYKLLIIINNFTLGIN